MNGKIPFVLIYLISIILILIGEPHLAIIGLTIGATLLPSLLMDYERVSIYLLVLVVGTWLTITALGMLW